MPDSRKHRGKHPSDEKEFSSENLIRIQHAFSDVSYLLDRGYPVNASIEIAGNRYKLSKRQRMAILRCACTSEAKNIRLSKQTDGINSAGEEIWIDGFNLLITLETLLSGGIILQGPDGCMRDLSGIHGSYRKVTETHTAVDLIHATFAYWGISRVRWLFDSPVSNSGRIAGFIRERAAELGSDWETELVFNPDKVLCEKGKIVVSSDSYVLDNCRSWINLAASVIKINKLSPAIINISAED
jgi:hypothetical protein